MENTPPQIASRRRHEGQLDWRSRVGVMKLSSVVRGLDLTWAKFPSSEASTSDTAKSDFPAELEVPDWRSCTCPSRGIQNKREKKINNFRVLPTFHTPSADWSAGCLATSPFSVLFINTIPCILIDRGLRCRLSRFTRRPIANKTPVD